MFKKYLILSAILHLIVIFGVGSSLPFSSYRIDETDKPFTFELTSPEERKITEDSPAGPPEPLGPKTVGAGIDKKTRVIKKIAMKEGTEESSPRRSIENPPLDKKPEKREEIEYKESKTPVRSEDTTPDKKDETGEPDKERDPRETRGKPEDINAQFIEEEAEDNKEDFLNNEAGIFNPAGPKDDPSKAAGPSAEAPAADGMESGSGEIPAGTERVNQPAQTAQPEDPWRTGQKAAKSDNSDPLLQIPGDNTGTRSTEFESPPVGIMKEPPVYPLKARRKKWEGVVVLSALVGKDGNVGEVEVIDTSGHDLLDAEAVKAVKKWKYKPALKNGMPVECRIKIKIKFELEE